MTTYLELPRSGGASSLADLTAVQDGSAAPVGTIGELQVANIITPTTANVAATGTFGYVLPLVLTAGVWIIKGVVYFDANGANLSQPLIAGISDTTDGTNLTTFDVVEHQFITPAATIFRAVVPDLHINIAAGSTYYLNTQFNYSSGSPRHAGGLIARRYR